MFRPIAAIIRFSFASVVVALIGLVWLYHDGEISTSVVFFTIVKGHGGRGGHNAHHRLPLAVSLNNSKHHRC